ncbi:unnamed protein product [Nesidiocoris tenuis]|nr:unnamed protein product [Nesidiocoris tenuis]
MDITSTPKARVLSASNRHDTNAQSPFAVPPTPVLKKIGWGTGVGVFHMDRSPFSGIARSPWALKKVIRAPRSQRSIRDRLKMEAEILKKFNHPNIVGFRGFTKTADGREVLAMEECDQDLGSILEKRFESGAGPMDAQLILKIVYETSKALDYIHTEHRVIHGDMKSYNILIKGNFEEIKLSDFGVSFPVDENGIASNYVGTEIWSAPEVIKDRVACTKSDIFSLGLTIWEMICTVPPHTLSSDQDDSMSGSGNSGADESMEEPSSAGTRPNIPFELDSNYDLVVRLFEWCTEENASKRPSAAEIVSFIEKNLHNANTDCSDMPIDLE